MSILQGLRVVELSATGVAAMAGKQFADWGADVLILEPTEGSALRHAPPYYEADGERHSGSWAWLSRGKRSTRVGPGTPIDVAAALALCADADVVLLESELAEPLLGIPPAELRGRLEERTTCVLIAPFATDGPYAGYRASDLGLAAMGGWMWMTRDPGREPIRPGLDVSYRVAGVAAFNAALVGLRTVRAGAAPPLIDLSLQAVTASMYIASWLRKQLLGEGQPAMPNSFPIGPVRAQDGWVGAPPLTAQHWESLVTMMGRPEVLELPELEDPMWRILHGEELYEEHFRDWVEARTRAEIVAEAQAWQIPSAGVETVADRLDCPQLSARDFYRQIEVEGRTLKTPRVAYQIEGAEPVARGPLREDEPVEAPTEPAAKAEGTPAPPLECVRVLDLTTWWSGPSATMVMGALGADVIRLESIQRPDGYRMAYSPLEGETYFWEKGFLWLDTNVNKRSLTLDLSSPRGLELFDRLLPHFDVVISNYSNRVLPNLGIDAARVHAHNPRAIFVTMPGYAPGGPWGEYVGFGTAFEYTAVSASVTGYADGRPKQSVLCDPTVGYHALSAVLLALERREQTGAGSTVEVPQAETLDTLYAPEWIALQLGAPVPERQGNRHAWMAPHNAYQVGGGDAWITIAVASDEQFAALCDALGCSELAADERFAGVEARKRHEVELDELLAEALRERDQHELERELQQRGVMALRVVRADDLTEEPGLEHIGYLQWLERPIGRALPYRTAVFRLDGKPTANVRPPPSLGEHNRELLSELLGMSSGEIAGLEAEGLIGTAPAGLA